MRFGKRPLYALLPLALMLPVFHGSATTLTWSTYSAWKLNVTSPLELNFGAINATSGNYSTAAGKTLNPLSGPALPFVFTGPYTGGYQLTGGEYGLSNAFSLLGPTAPTGDITVNLPSGGENAILLGLGSMGNATTITVVLSDGESFNVAAAPNANEFLGLSISHDINWLTISASSEPIVNDFFFASSKLAQDGPTAPPPAAEGATLYLIGGGCCSWSPGGLLIFALARTPQTAFSR